MSKYGVCIPVFASIWVEVEAESKEEAIQKASDSACPPSLCWHCAGKVDMNDLDYDNAVAEELDD